VAIRIAVLVLVEKFRCLSSLASNTTSELDVLWHDGHTLGVNCAQVCVFEKTDQIGFTGFLKCHDSTRLEAEIGLEILSDFTN
jgi:hypothetical protein